MRGYHLFCVKGVVVRTTEGGNIPRGLSTGRVPMVTFFPPDPRHPSDIFYVIRCGYFGGHITFVRVPAGELCVPGDGPEYLNMQEERFNDKEAAVAWLRKEAGA